MILEILLIVTLFLWFLSLLPIPQIAPLGAASGWLAWLSAVFITLILFVPALR